MTFAYAIISSLLVHGSYVLSSYEDSRPSLTGGAIGQRLFVYSAIQCYKWIIYGSYALA